MGHTNLTSVVIFVVFTVLILDETASETLVLVCVTVIVADETLITVVGLGVTLRIC